MAVIVRKKVKIGDKDVEMRTYLPPGGLSKDDRVRADRLDETLNQKIPIIDKKISDIAKEEGNLVYSRYMLGQYLREIIDDPELVSRADVDNKLVFMAIWDHLPNSLRPVGSAGGKLSAESQHRRKDHLMLCYEISGFDWSEVEWIKRWDDWFRLAFSPGLLRDKRIIKALSEAICDLETYPSSKTFREITMHLSKAFPTRPLRDSSVFSDEKIDQIVRETLDKAYSKLENKLKAKTSE